MKRPSRGKDNLVGAASAIIGILAALILVAATLLRNQPIEDRAFAVLKENEDAMMALNSYRAECWTTTVKEDQQSGMPPKMEYALSTITAVKPNVMRYDNWAARLNATGAFQRKTPNPQFVFACDGATNTRQYGDKYTIDHRTGPEYMRSTLEPWDGFYDRAASPHSLLRFRAILSSGPFAWFFALLQQDKNPRLTVLHLGPITTLYGVSCSVLTYHYRDFHSNEWSETTGTLYIGSDKLIRQQVETTTYDRTPGVRVTHNAIIKNIHTNFPAPPPQTFTYTPPKGIIQLPSSIP